MTDSRVTDPELKKKKNVVFKNEKLKNIELTHYIYGTIMFPDANLY